MSFCSKDIAWKKTKGNEVSVTLLHKPSGIEVSVENLETVKDNYDKAFNHLIQLVNQHNYDRKHGTLPHCTDEGQG